MNIQPYAKNGFRVRTENEEFVFLKPGFGSTIEDRGKRGGYIVTGKFAAISSKIVPPNLEFWEDYTEYIIDIFACSDSLKKSKPGLTYDNYHHVHLCFFSLMPEEGEESAIVDYIKFMSYERALKLCEVISNKKIDSTEDLSQADLKLFDYIKSHFYT